MGLSRIAVVFSIEPRNYRGLRLISAAALAFALLGATALANPADLDPSFSGDGKVTASNLLAGYAVARDASGRLLVAGSAPAGEFGASFALARYKPDGSLDTSFGGGDGTVTTPIGDDQEARAFDVAIQPDGKIVAAGYESSNPPDSPPGSDEFAGCDSDFYVEDEDFAVARYNPDGSLDSSFSGDGIAGSGFVADRWAVGNCVKGGNNDQAHGVEIDSQGRIVVAGFGDPSDQGGATDFAVSRFTPGGELDPSFSGDGRATANLVDTGAGDFGLDVAVTPDDRIVVVGRTTLNQSKAWALARWSPDGTLDPSFGGGNGIRVRGFSGDEELHGVALQPDGKIVAAGWGQFEGDQTFVVARFNADGSDDTSFGFFDEGYSNTAFAGGETQTWDDVAIQPDGRIVTVGSVGVGSPSSDFAVGRFTADGEVDRTFSDCDGAERTDFGGVTDAHGVVLQPDGKIVAAGESFEGLALARYVGGNADPPDCDAPDTRIKGPSKTDDRTPTFKLKSTERNSEFECKLDKKQNFKSCPAKFTPKVRPGRHKLKATAIDPAGNPDPSPARKKFTVTK